MKIKKRLKYKSTLPKADYGMDPNALSNMNKQAAQETPAQGGGMGAGAALGVANGALDFVTSFAPKDNNDGIGISHKGSAISKGITGGLHAGADMAKAVPGVGTIVGGVMDAAATIGEFITGMVDKVREKDRSRVSRLARKEYDPTQDNVGYSFGNRATPSAAPVFGGQADAIAKYGMPLFGDGGSAAQTTSKKVEPIYTGDPYDKRIKAFQDSSFLHKQGRQYNKDVYDFKDDNLLYFTPNSFTYKGWTKEEMNKNIKEELKDNIVDEKNFTNGGWNSESIKEQKMFNNIAKKALSTNNMPVGSYSGEGYFPAFQKPVQPVIFKPVPRAGNINIRSESLEGFKNGGEPTMKEYKDFNNFRKTVNPDYLSKDYDLQSAFLELPSKVLYEWQQNPEKNHLPDTYKLPNHPTFSTESKYYKPGMPAGYWKGDTYVPIDRPASTVTTNTNLLGLDDPNKQKNIMNKELERNNGVRPGYALGGDPRSQSNIEAEQGEAMQHSSGKIEAIGGKKHENGGTPLQVQPSHEYIYSDSLGYDREGNMTLDENLVRYSFADNAKKIERKYKGREMDSIVQKTKELELGKLKQDAEQARVAKEEIEMGKQMKKYKAKYGANLKRFDNSGFIFNQKDYIDWIKQTPEYKENTLTDLGGSDAATVYRPRYAENIYDQYGADAYNTVVNTFSNRKYGYTPGSDTSKNTYYKTSVGDWPMTNPYSNSGKGIAGNYGGTYPGSIGNKQFLFPNSGGPKPFQPGYLENVMKNSGVDLNKPLNGGIAPMSRATASIDQRSTAPEVADKVKNGMFSSLTTGDKMQLASMLPAFGFNMGMGLRKADVEPNRKNLYEKDVVNIMQNRKFDIQNYLNQSNLATNTAKEDIGNNSTSVGGKMANLQKLFANQSNALGDITTKGQEMNNQYRAEEANTKNIIGEANRAESIRAAGINDQNKARKQQFLAKAFEQMGQGIATTGQAANQSLTNKLLIKSLSEISPDFNVKNMKDIERMSVDKDSYIVFDGVKTEFKMSDEGKIVMAGGTPNTANAAKSQYAPKEFTMKAFANFTKTKTKG